LRKALIYFTATCCTAVRDYVTELEFIDVIILTNVRYYYSIYFPKIRS